MTRKSGMKSWPPRWTNTTGNSQDKPRGEVGKLPRVAKHPSIENSLFIWNEYRGSIYVAAMYFDDLAFCHIMRRILASHIGLSIKEIAIWICPSRSETRDCPGNLDLPEKFANMNHG